MLLCVIESKERLFEALLECAPLRSLCFLVIEMPTAYCLPPTAFYIARKFQNIEKDVSGSKGFGKQDKTRSEDDPA